MKHAVRVRGSTATITIVSKGETYRVRVDRDDLSKLDGCRLSLRKGYVRVARDGWITSLHRLVTGAQPGQEVHHDRRDKLDNRRAALDVLTPEQHRRHKWGRGYGWCQRAGKWRVQVWAEGRPNVFGYFGSERRAAAVAKAVKDRLRTGATVADVRAVLSP